MAAASDLKFALDEAVRQMTSADGAIRVEVTYGSSGNFHAQLQQRAPFDLFLSADSAYPRDLVARGIGDPRDVFVYARGALVAWVPTASPLPLEREGLRALLRARRIAIANPRHAPYGRAAEAALRSAGIWKAVEGRLVLGENIAQTAQFVESGSADVALIARSLAVAAPMARAGRYVEVPAGSYAPLLQAGLVLPWAGSPDAAFEVRDFLMSEGGRALLRRFGFDIPSAPAPAPSAGARSAWTGLLFA